MRYYPAMEPDLIGQEKDGRSRDRDKPKCLPAMEPDLIGQEKSGDRSRAWIALCARNGA